MQFIYFIKLEIMQYFNDKVSNNAHVEILKIQVYKILKFTLCQNSCCGSIFTFSSFFALCNFVRIYVRDAERALAFLMADSCSAASAAAAASPRHPATLRYLAKLRAAISSASSICFL